MQEILTFKCGTCKGETITRSELEKEFNKNLQYPNGWAREFGSLEACIKAWFYQDKNNI